MIQEKKKQLGEQLAALRKEAGLNNFQTFKKYNLPDHVVKSVLSGSKNYTMDTFLILLGEVGKTIKNNRFKLNYKNGKGYTRIKYYVEKTYKRQYNIDSGIFYSVRLNFQSDFGKTIAFCAKDLGFVESIDKNGFINYEKDPYLYYTNLKWKIYYK